MQMPADKPPARLALVVDDDEPVRRMVARILTDGGFHVLEAESGSAAVAMMSDLITPVELVVSDVAMPGVRGEDLAAAVTKRWPGVRVLLISGYGAPGGYDYPFLPKPFVPETLLDAIAALVPPPKH